MFRLHLSRCLRRRQIIGGDLCLSRVIKLFQIGVESGVDTVSESLIDSGACAAWRRERACFALVFVRVCVTPVPCHSVPGPRDLRAHLALTLWKSSLSPKARDLCYDSRLCQAFTNYTRRYNGLLSGAQPLTGAATVICESLLRRRRRAPYLRNANNVPPNQTTATITADWIFLPFLASLECEVFN